jgi:hypothetical protein
VSAAAAPIGPATHWAGHLLDLARPGGRLDRGRAYARAGRVLTLRVESGLVAAAVQGSRPSPYTVALRADPLPAPVWRRIAGHLAGCAADCAGLLAGDLPPGLVRVCDASGAPLLPTDAGALRVSCDCPDPQVPCKHLTAVYLRFAGAADADPFTLLRWRGRDRDALLAGVRAHRARIAPPGPDAGAGRGACGAAVRRGRPADPAGADPVDEPLSAAAALRGLAEPVDDAGRWWAQPATPPPAPPGDPHPVWRHLPPPGPEIGGDRLGAALHAAYARFRRAY